MFYRRKAYIVKNEFVGTFNAHFNETNLPNQLKHGARFIGRWTIPMNDSTTEIFAIWEYDSYEKYKKIESAVRGDTAHVKRINAWFDKHGGRGHVYQELILKVKNEQIFSTSYPNDMTHLDVQFWLKD